VCEQCHLQGESRILRRGREQFDYRPGLPLHLFVSVFVRSLNFVDRPSVGGHSEQMQLSRCYVKSQGKLGCITCHDPHPLPAPNEKGAFYRGRCLSCHKETSCSLSPAARQEKDRADNCVACHLPRTGSNIAHTAVTDHRIVRRPGDVEAAPRQPRP